MQHTANGEPERFVAPHLITAKYGVAVATLRRWAEDGKLEVRRCPGGKRLYRMSDVGALFGEEKEGNTQAVKAQRATVIYARVSSDKQRGDLERQIYDLQSAYPNCEVIKDVASGLNWKRKGFVSLLERAHGGEFSRVVVAHKDRLCRFAFELVRWVLEKAGVEIVVHGECPASKDELADDLLSVVNVFVARNNGRRSAEGRKRRRDQKAPEEEGKPQIEGEEQCGGGGERRPRKKRRTSTTHEGEKGENLP